MSEWKACLRPGAKSVWGIGAAVSSVSGMERGFSVCCRAVLYMYIWLLNVEGGIQNIPWAWWWSPCVTERALDGKTGQPASTSCLPPTVSTSFLNYLTWTLQPGKIPYVILREEVLLLGLFTAPSFEAQSFRAWPWFLNPNEVKSLEQTGTLGRGLQLQGLFCTFQVWPSISPEKLLN